MATTPHNRLVRLLSEFRASFACGPEDDGIRVTRTLSLELAPPAGWMLDGYLQRRRQTSAERELELTSAVVGVP